MRSDQIARPVGSLFAGERHGLVVDLVNDFVGVLRVVVEECQPFDGRARKKLDELEGKYSNKKNAERGARNAEE